MTHDGSHSQRLSRRDFQRVLAAAGVSSVACSARHAPAEAGRPPAGGRAQSCILIWLGGGMCHVDTFDPKRVGDPAIRKPGSAYPSIPTAIADVRVCKHLKRVAPLMDRGVIIRSLHHPLKVDHADSTNLMKTGRLTSGTVVYPSLGSVISHQLGEATPGVPPYVVMGYPNVTRGPGFLGSRHGYIYLTDTAAGPTGLRRPADIDPRRQAARKKLLTVLRRRTSAQAKGALRDYDSVIDRADKLMRGRFPQVFDLSQEPSTSRTRYGGEFGQRCLLARRLVASGTRFIEVAYDLNFKNGTGWDTHRHGQANQHLLIEDLDRALSALILDLEKQRLLDKTLVVVATEFGRPPDFDAQGGRGHQSAAFSAVLFGGGLNSGQVIGATDEWGRKPVERPISVPDFHTTLLTTMGIDPSKNLYDGDRPIPITDHGQAILPLFTPASRR